MKPKSTEKKLPFTLTLLHPRFWAIWLGIVLLAPLAFLPWCLQLGLGNGLGWLIWQLGKRRRNDTLTNLRLCFPNQSDNQYKQMGLAVFKNAGIGIFESLSAWFFPYRFKKNITIDGLETVTNALSNGQSVLILGAHYTLLDLGGLLCSRFFTADIIYRPQNNALLEWLIYTCRANIYGQQIDHRDMRSLIKALKDNHAVWYTPDQDFGLKAGVMAPFFNVPAATITAQRRLAKVNNAVVVAIHFYRKPARTFWQKIGISKPHYHIYFTASITPYPTDDEVADATFINQILTQLISIAPTQYMWFHRRFKTRPTGMERVY